MTRLFIITVLLFAGCASSKKDSAGTVHGTPQKDSGTTPMPPCIAQLIDSFKKEPVQNPPRSIYCYTYNGKTVYYIPAICCDMFSDLLDSSCHLLGHPDGGFTGRGDGQYPDFKKTVKNEKLLWHDPR